MKPPRDSVDFPRNIRIREGVYHVSEYGVSCESGVPVLFARTPGHGSSPCPGPSFLYMSTNFSKGVSRLQAIKTGPVHA